MPRPPLWKDILEIVLSVTYYVLAGCLLIWILMVSDQVSQNSAELYAQRSPAAQIDNRLKSFFSDITFGLYEEGTVRAEALAELIIAVKEQQQHMHRLSWLLAGLSLLYLMLVSLLNKQRQGWRWHHLTLHSLGASTLLLVAGLLAPMFALVIYQQLPVLGEVVFRHDAKGILGTIWTLVQSRNWFVAVLLFSFSVLVPVLKLLLTLSVLIRPRQSQKLFATIQSVSKWSMTDVFVVAVLLSVFALSSDGLTDARLHIGLYFFAAYSLLSIISTQLLAQSSILKKPLVSVSDMARP